MFKYEAKGPPQRAGGRPPPLRDAWVFELVKIAWQRGERLTIFRMSSIAADAVTQVDMLMKALYPKAEEQESEP